MNFLHPALLAALPLAALPIIIHLINQRRYQSLRWGAMMFLLAANRMSRGYARVRQWLILAMRVLAIAGLIFAISRPLASGWLGLATGGRPDTTIILLDRSPSMQQSDSKGGDSKLETGRRQLVQALDMLGSGRYVVIDGATRQPGELESPEALLKSSASEPASCATDMPALLQAAHDYMLANKSGRTEIWICSDLRENDWNADSGRWPALREAFQTFAPGVRFHLLAYPQTAPGNLAIRATAARRVATSDGAALAVSLKLLREGGGAGRVTVPLGLELDGVRSQTTVVMQGSEFELKDHRIPLDGRRARGWARVSIPADSNGADNDYYFVFDRPVERRTVIVSDQTDGVRALQLAAAASPDPTLTCRAEIVPPEQLAAVEWEKTALVLWQAALPVGDAARRVAAYVERGGQVVFFPPRVPDDASMFGGQWQAWAEEPAGFPITAWRGDQDLLAHTQSGAALPVGAVQVHRYCRMSGEATPLASLRGGAPLLARLATNRGGVYFCGTSVDPADSSLAHDGVVLYVMVQRALAAGAAALGNTRDLAAGDTPPESAAAWRRLAGPAIGLSTEFAVQRGVYAAGEQLLAVNRPLAEEQAPVLADRRVAELFRGLDYSRVNDQAGSLDTLIQEIWRLFLSAMIAALLVEAALCLPRSQARPAGRAA